MAAGNLQRKSFLGFQGAVALALSKTSRLLLRHSWKLQGCQFQLTRVVVSLFGDSKQFAARDSSCLSTARDTRSLSTACDTRSLGTACDTRSLGTAGHTL
jgi:hypothetical protein